MSAFVESMRRLYKKGRVKVAKVESLFQEGKISKEEKDYILN